MYQSRLTRFYQEAAERQRKQEAQAKGEWEVIERRSRAEGSHSLAEVISRMFLREVA